MSCVSVQEGYARWAPVYDEAPNPLLALEERYLQPLLPSIKGKRVLDLACGTGRWSSRLLARGTGPLIGIDFSRPMLEEANKKHQLRGRLVAADCYALPFRDSAFDLVLCSFAIGHLRHAESLASEVSRIAAEAADVYVTDIHPSAYAQGWKTAFRDEEGPWVIATWPRSLEDQVAVWRLAGFHCVQTIAASLDEPERPFLVRAGKGDLFERVRRIPAIQILHFRSHKFTS